MKLPSLVIIRNSTQYLAVLAYLVFFSQSADAQGYGFLQRGVLSGFPAEDVAAFREFVRDGLNAVPDMQVIDWHSPTSQRAGKLVARFTYQSNGTTCRRSALQVEDERGRTENYRFDLCRTEEGWAIEEAPANLNASDRRELEQFIDTVIGSGEEGVPVTWIGSRSGHQAVIVPLAPVASEGCRNAAVTLIDRGGNSIGGQYVFCRDDIGDFWEYTRPNF